MTTSNSTQTLYRFRWQCIGLFVAWCLLGAYIGVYHYTKTLSTVPLRQTFQLVFIGGYLLALLIGARLTQWFYKDRYKKSIVGPFLTESLGKTTYHPYQHIKGEDLRHSGLFDDFNVTTGSDWFQSPFRTATLTASNLSLHQIIYTSEGAQFTVVFSGAFVMLAYDRSFEATLLVKERRWLSWSWGKSQVHHKVLESIKLIAPAFMKHFEVWSDDQIVARKILTPSLMEKMTSLAKQTPFSLSIHQHIVNIALKERLDFNPRFFLLPPRSEARRQKKLAKSIDSLRALLETLALEEKLK